MKIEQIKVVAGLILQNNKLLICQRPKFKDHPLKWEFPGGKIKNDETNEEALIREINEELSINILNYEERKKLIKSLSLFTIYIWILTSIIATKF